MDFLLLRRTFLLPLSLNGFYLIFSWALGTGLILLDYPLFILIIFKVIYWLALFLLFSRNPLGKKLIFYFNLGVTKTALFAIPFFYDICLTLVSYLMNVHVA